MWHSLERPNLIQTILKRKQEEILYFHESTTQLTHSWPAGPTSFAWTESRGPWKAADNGGSTHNDREICELFGLWIQMPEADGLLNAKACFFI